MRGGPVLSDDDAENYGLLVAPPQREGPADRLHDVHPLCGLGSNRAASGVLNSGCSLHPDLGGV